MGGEPQLVMLLSGGAGCGKSVVIARAQEFCFLFCQSMGIPFDEKTIYLSSSSGSSAALLGGTTTHNAGYINSRRIKDEDRVGWKPVRIFVVDEVSFLKVKDMTELNRKLQNLREDTSKPFGGVSIIFLGDFHQLQPVMGTNSDILYLSSPNALWWRNTINAAVVLQSNHRFKEDKPYGDFLDHMRRG